MRILLALLLVLLPATASALSCLAPNAGRALTYANENGERRHVVIGTLTPPHQIPSREGYDDVTATYWVSGKEILPDGPDRAFAAAVTFRSGCIVSWCGPVPSVPAEGLFLLRPLADDGYLLATGPCGGGIYLAPSPAKIKILRTCIARGGCTDAEIDLLEFNN